MTSLIARGLVADEADHASSVPTDWTGFTFLFDEGDLAGGTGGQGIGYPSVIRATDRIASPIDDFYLYCTAHTPSTKITLFTAPHPLGPWTDRGTVLSAMPASHNDLSPAFALWNPGTSEVWLWVGSKRTDNATQDTYFYKSADGEAFTIQNGGLPVLTGAGNNTGPADGYEAEYMTVIPHGDDFIGMYQGINKSSPNDVAHACMATSPDGVAWSRTTGPGILFGATFAHAAWANDAGDDVENCGSFKPLIFELDAGIFAYYPYVDTAGSPALARCRRKLPGRGWTAPFDFGLGIGGSGAWDENRRSGTDLLYYDGSFWLFYGGGPSGPGEAVGVAECEFPQSGFDTSWGKG